MDQPLGLMHFWSNGDGVIHAVAYLLLLMSIASWYWIFLKSWNLWQARRAALTALPQFWGAPSLEDATAQLQTADSEKLFAPLAAVALQAAQRPPENNSLNAKVDPSDLITRSLRQQISRAAAQLESGMTLLASVGSTAPFVGLFGTVWGIYHALLNIAGAGQIAIDRVAGPVGEALIMTALGLAVAIPAVLAYNAFARGQRLLLAELDGFAHDLHATLTTGSRVNVQ
ncbi:MAG: MotA/TolQ/ExbB proton channel family protein [Burkholderiaceae bacterium]|nr:MAG: MotA/TolQ/ExbB proton channel family protein [Burkholderiaceae bacterium]